MYRSKFDEFDDGLLFFYGEVLLLIVYAKYNRAELLNSNTSPTAKIYLLPFGTVAIAF